MLDDVVSLGISTKQRLKRLKSFLISKDEVLLIVFKPFPLLLPPERYIDIKALMTTLIVITREEVARLVTRSKQEVLVMPVRCWRDRHIYIL